MTEAGWLALLRGAGHVSLALLAGGALFLLIVRRMAEPGGATWSLCWARRLLWVALAYLICAAAAVLLQAAIAADEPLLLVIGNTEVLRAYGLGTRYGQLALTGLAVASLMLAPAVALGFSAGAKGLDSLCLGALGTIATLTAGITSLAGHATADEATRWLVPLRVGHVLAMSLWFGGLPFWVFFVAWSARQPKRATERAMLPVLRRFSRLAMACMAVIVLSGVALASTFMESMGDLLGTRYGLLVCAKVLLLAGALLIANRVRRRFLPTLAGEHEPGCARAAARFVAYELLLATAVLGLAAVLGETVPAIHDQPVWPLPFRISLAATWPVWPAPLVATVAALLLASGLGLLAVAYRRLTASARTLCALVALTGVAVAGWQLSVPAYPDTYRRSTVPYVTVSIMAGMHRFTELCTGCHGPGGLGDGPLRNALPKPPANLSEPHTALHTAGDMFWWLIHGIPQSGMPGFAAELDEQARWDVINFLRAFSQGFQARILSPSIIPERPWLGAPDFYFEDANGTQRELKDYRERSNVLLVFPSDSNANAAQRTQQLAAAAPELRSARCEILVVAADAPEMSGIVVIRRGVEEIRSAYDLLSRTIIDRGDGRQLGMGREHMEFLLDRFGYIRARWVPAEEPGRWSQPEKLLPGLHTLNAEPRILPPPDTHVH